MAQMDRRLRDRKPEGLISLIFLGRKWTNYEVLFISKDLKYKELTPSLGCRGPCPLASAGPGDRARPSGVAPMAGA